MLLQYSFKKKRNKLWSLGVKHMTQMDDEMNLPKEQQFWCETQGITSAQEHCSGT